LYIETTQKELSFLEKPGIGLSELQKMTAL